ncbi:hypothetical protein PHET_01981 [Paragonimus heterotremus]|uniref:Uncharacterized protein n=1 Tax=Paragonimus heterotremus TaxID=100268 RepID=A0A8J4TQV0_9TREM|nr:hypothetical protein PHET_01981 [Paragonimus heterotremus]
MINSLSTFTQVSLLLIFLVFATVHYVKGGLVMADAAYYGNDAPLRNPYNSYDSYDEVGDTDPDLRLLLRHFKRNRHFTQRLGK